MVDKFFYIEKVDAKRTKWLYINTDKCIYTVEGGEIGETAANYVSLSVTRPDLVEMLHKDKPELSQVLDEMIVKFLAKADAI